MKKPTIEQQAAAAFAQVMTTGEVVAHLKLSRQRVSQLLKDGRLIGEVRPGTAIFFRASVEAFAKIERTNQPLSKERK